MGLLVMLGLLSALTAASIDLCAPGLPRLGHDLNASSASTHLVITLFLVGVAVGQVAGGVLSDARGRRGPVIQMLAGFVASSVWCAWAPTMPTLLGGRFVQGIFAAGAMVIARAVVRDLFEGAAAARYLSRLVLVYGLSPVLAPLVGGAIVHYWSWRGLFIFTASFAVVLSVAVVRELPETLAPELRRPARAGGVARSFHALGSDRSFVGYALAQGLATGMLVVAMTMAPFVFQEQFGASPQMYGLILAASAATMVTGSQINARLVLRIQPRSVLLAAQLASIAVALAACALSLPAWGPAPLAICIAGLFCCYGFIPANAIALASLGHAGQAGTSAAAIGLAQYGLGGLAAMAIGSGMPDTALSLSLGVVVLCVLSALAAAGLTAANPKLASEKAIAPDHD
jgi:DHA1 family bicyclomycin/chloramphenicol resistance-like MFS transporter